VVVDVTVTVLFDKLKSVCAPAVHVVVGTVVPVPALSTFILTDPEPVQVIIKVANGEVAEDL
jgi:hypothetical protein